MPSAELSVWRGSAAEFHARAVEATDVSRVWVFEVTAPALVLGSTQPLETADAAACAAVGVAVVHRRSGGGAVLLVPNEVVWFDVVVPVVALHAAGVGDDIGRSMVWLGEHVAAALAALAVVGTAVHNGHLVATPWSRLVCFDSLGPGEVTTAAGKLVGISQRRTRHAARFQCALHVHWSPETLVPLLAPPRPTAPDLGPVATLPAQLAAALPPALAQRLT